MKVLSIGNSFSTDAQHWLHGIAVSEGYDLMCANLYIGGCSLERHYNNMQDEIAAYQYQINGDTTPGDPVSIQDALDREAWDVVTIQQNSRFAGIPESYEPYLSALVACVKEHAPDAKIWFHQTWALESGTTPDDFEAYHFNTDEMADRIIEASEYHAKNLGLSVIPTGRVIAHFRRNVPEFRFETGGLRVTRDVRHLSLVYGRYIAGLVFYAFLTGNPVKNNTFVPTAPNEEADPHLLTVIRDSLTAWLDDYRASRN